MNRRTTATALVVLLLSLVAACGGDESVGDEALLEGTDGETGLRLGETTTTTAPAGESITETTAPPETAPPPTQAPQTTAPPATSPPTTEAQRATLDVTINSDSTAGGQFQPRVGQVFVGSLVRFTNTDSVARSVKADDGSFDSGPIAPGGTWEYVANQAGTFNYSDGTRPYAVGSLEVYAQ